jgi:hypothetical protein
MTPSPQNILPLSQAWTAQKSQIKQGIGSPGPELTTTPCPIHHLSSAENLALRQQESAKLPYLMHQPT